MPTTARDDDDDDDSDSSDDDDDDDDDGADDDDDSGGERLHVSDGLCESVLAALLEFQHGGGRFDDDDSNYNGTIIASDTICAAYRAQDTAMIAATLRRLQEQEHGEVVVTTAVIESSDHQAPHDTTATERVVEALLVDASRSNWTVLGQDGVV
jgi:major membrane immunogen (membrane-anchored lipoprotein)